MKQSLRFQLSSNYVKICRTYDTLLIIKLYLYIYFDRILFFILNSRLYIYNSV